MLAFLGLSAGVFAQVGGTRDVPTQVNGSFWRQNRTLKIEVPSADFNVTLQIQERFTKTLSSTTITSNSIAGPYKLYVRNRSATTVTGTGILTISGFGANLLVRPSATSAGYDWRSIDDLSEVRESFGISGTVWADASTVSVILNALFLLDFTLDHGAALEYADFPVQVAGERWTSRPIRRVFGNIRLAIPTFNAPVVGTVNATTVDESFDASLAFTFTHTYTADGTSPAPSVFAGSNRITGDNGDDIWYSSAVKDFSDVSYGTITLNDSGGSVVARVSTFRTQLSGTVSGTDYSVLPDSNISGLAITPARPRWGEPFVVSGTVSGPATAITGRVLATGAVGNSLVTSGQFAISMTAPSANDSSPMIGAINKDWGSFGIELERDSSPPPHRYKVATLQLGKPLIRVSIDSQTVTENGGPFNVVIQLVDFQGNLAAASRDMTVSVAYGTGSGSAISATDFLPAAGTATIPAGSSSVSIPVTLVNDVLVEPVEDFTFTISSPGADVDLATAIGQPVVQTITLVDDDGGPVPTATPSPTPTASPTVSATPTATPSPSPTPNAVRDYTIYE